MSRDIRRLLHTKEGGRYFMKGHPGRVIREGEEILSIPINKPLTIYRKQNGTVWELPFSSNGNQTVLRNLKVKGNHHIDKNLTINNDLTIDGEIKGTRLVFNFGTAAASSTSFYMKTVNGVGMSSDLGYAMHRPGSIVGVSARFQCTNYTHTEGWSVVVYKNGAEVFNTFPGVSVTSDTSPAYYSTYDTQARGTDTFVAGDLIQVKMNPTIGSRAEIDNVIGYFEVIFDD